MRMLLWAEWLKTKRSALRWLVVLLPALMGLVLAWYVAGRPWISAASAFSGFFFLLGIAGAAVSDCHCCRTVGG